MRKLLAVISILVFLLQACGMAPLSQATPATMTSQVTQDPTIIATATLAPPTATITPSIPAATPTVTTTFTPIPYATTSTLTSCMQAGGRVEISEITTILLPAPLVYRIYLPPCYDEEPELYYPVLYLIHGMNNSDIQWDSLGVPETADALIRAGDATPFIVVMPRDRVWVEPTEDNFGKAVKQTLVPWIDEHYRTIPDRAHRAIGGLSRGGAWAVNIGLSNWDTFSKVGVHSGFVFFSDTQNVHQWLKDAPAGMVPSIYMDIGSGDRPEIANGCAWLEDLLTRYDVPHEWHLFTGEHEDAYWQSHVEDYLRWYTMDW